MALFSLGGWFPYCYFLLSTYLSLKQTVNLESLKAGPTGRMSLKHDKKQSFSRADTGTKHWAAAVTLANTSTIPTAKKPFFFQEILQNMETEMTSPLPDANTLAKPKLFLGIVLISAFPILVPLYIPQSSLEVWCGISGTGLSKEIWPPWHNYASPKKTFWYFIWNSSLSRNADPYRALIYTILFSRRKYMMKQL